MNQGIKSVLCPVKDIARAKSLFSQFVSIQLHSDHAYYVGFRVGDQEIGLTPKGHDAGMTGFYHVDDFKKSLHLLWGAGAQVMRR